ncbi:MAG: LPS assembly protein LptD [Proteobacteria bacterium]|nr:LPS assembly protein LptD [Pseudomonadota bacterium]
MPRLTALFGVLAGLIGATLLPTPEALAQTLKSGILFRADDLTYDNQNAVVTARGNIEVSVGERILVAEVVSYAQQTGIITASGNVAVLEPSGNVFFADEVKLTEDLREGVLSGFRALLAEQTRIAAVGAERRGGNITTMTKAVFTACKLCEKDRQRAPLWQIKAFKVVHNENLKRIEYKDVVLEFFGIPVAYSPYFSHPDPSVKRKSGLLAPIYGSSSQLGLRLQVPYYINIAPNRDATLAPIFTSKEGVVGAGEYREKTTDGEFSFSGSLTRADERDQNNAKTGSEEFRGHIFGTGHFLIDETWSWGFELERTTDDTYLRRYDFGNQDALTTNAFVEGFRGRNYASANAYLFQGLRSDDDPGATPIIPLLLDFNHVGEPGRFGQTWRLTANALILRREVGASSNRLSLEGGWHLPHTSPGGALYNLSATVRGDLYDTDDVATSADPSVRPDDGLTGRVFPQLALDWRYPLAAQSGRFRQIIEPIIVGIVAPYGSNPADLPNEDSLNFEFDDTNLFSANRFPGFDRVEGGPRVNYGIRLGAYDQIGGYATLLFGQSIRLNDDDTFADKTGLEDNRSDYVGRLDLVPSDFVDLNQRIRMDRDTFSLRRHEVSLSAGPKYLRVDASYVSLSRELTTDELSGREEIDISSRLQVTPEWALTAGTRQDLKKDATLSFNSSLEYQDECLFLSVDFDRTFFSDRDLEPSTSVTVRLKLKHLG